MEQIKNLQNEHNILQFDYLKQKEKIEDRTQQITVLNNQISILNDKNQINENFITEQNLKLEELINLKEDYCRYS